MNLDYQRRFLERRLSLGDKNSLGNRLHLQRTRALSPSELQVGDIIKVFHKYEAKGRPDFSHPQGRHRRVNSYYGFATPVKCLVVENDDVAEHLILQIMPGNKLAPNHTLQQFQQSDKACLHRYGSRSILLIGRSEACSPSC